MEVLTPLQVRLDEVKVKREKETRWVEWCERPVGLPFLYILTEQLNWKD